MTRIALVVLAVVLTCSACGPDNREQARSYVRADEACTSDADCCVAFDGCLAQGLVVTKADFSTVQGLLAQASKDMCLDCIPPVVQVRCAAGVCKGTALKLEAKPGGTCEPYDTPLMRDHCGTLAIPDGCQEKATGGTSPASNSEQILGCGT